jgi:hypothetical protein
MIGFQRRVRLGGLAASVAFVGLAVGTASAAGHRVEAEGRHQHRADPQR